MMGRVTLALALVLLAISGFGQDLKDTYGKTNAQIRAMGYDRWYKFYTGKAGESTMGMADAATLYAAALYEANAKALAKLKPADRKRVTDWTKFGEEFEDTMIDLESRGGGTMWIPVRAHAGIDAEELRAKLIKLAAIRAAGLSKDEHREIHLKVMKVLKNLDAMSAIIAKDDPSLWQPGATKPGLLKDIKERRALVIKLEPDLLKNRYQEAKTLLDFLLQASNPERFKDIG